MSEHGVHRFVEDAEPRRLSLGEVVDELVLGWSTSEPVVQPALRRGAHQASCAYPAVWEPRHRMHVVHHPALLEQLDQTISNRTDDASGSGVGPSSRVIANVNALDALRRIQAEARWWLESAGRPVPVQLRERLRAVHLAEAALFGVRDERDRSVEAAAWSWRTTARVIAGWEKEPMRPRAICPQPECEQLDTILVRGASLAEGIAVCTACWWSWSGAEFLELGQWVSWATVHLLGAEHLVRVEAEGEDPRLEPCSECQAVRDEMEDRREARLRSRRPGAVAGRVGA